jgi:hypothetical protein
MYSNRVIFFTLFFGLMISNFLLSAAFNFKQDVTLTSFKSEEYSKEMVNQFLKAAEGDSDLKVIEIKYKQEKMKKDCIAYHAIITCLTSTPNDVQRIQCKSLLNNSRRDNP